MAKKSPELLKDPTFIRAVNDVALASRDMTAAGKKVEAAENALTEAQANRETTGTLYAEARRELENVIIAWANPEPDETAE